MRRASCVAAPVAHLVGPGKLKVVNGRLAFVNGADGPLRLDPEALRAVYCYGDVGVTDEAMTALFAWQVEVAWLTPAGTRCRGRLVRSDPSRTAVRMLQHAALRDPERQRQWAAVLVAGKIESQVKAARHYQRHGAGVGEELRMLEATLGQCPEVGLDELRGVEGACSAAWFRVLGRLLNPPWEFRLRTRRPPRDPVNALLSLGYTWLLTRTTARCEAAGLEVYLGALHEYRPGRPSLACDLMEPLRVPAVDRWVVFACNQGYVGAGDFAASEEFGIRLQPGRFAVILQSWEEYWHGQHQEAALDEWVGQFVTWLRGTESPEAASGPVPGE